MYTLSRWECLRDASNATNLDKAKGCHDSSLSVYKVKTSDTTFIMMTDCHAVSFECCENRVTDKEQRISPK